MPNFADRLNATILALKVRKGDFAEAGGVNGATLGGYLNDGRLPNQRTLANWVKKYNLNAHWLLTGEGEMFLADHQVPLTHPLAQRVNQVALVMAESGVDDLELLRTVRAMVEGEMDKLIRARGGYGAAEPAARLPRAAEDAAAYPARKKAAGDD
ncbi:MAG: hypothetical protein HY916_09065 [Desulfovibrio sp.]|jgi:hypothetical protein|nr:hypothetical protein [Desulfovibrio sp.]